MVLGPLADTAVVLGRRQYSAPDRHHSAAEVIPVPDPNFRVALRFISVEQRSEYKPYYADIILGSTFCSIPDGWKMISHKMCALKCHTRCGVCSLVQQIGDDPCGFCGATGCSARLVTQGERQQVGSNCSFRCSFKYGSAEKSTTAPPCANIPICCPHLEIQRCGPHHYQPSRTRCRRPR